MIIIGKTVCCGYAGTVSNVADSVSNLPDVVSSMTELVGVVLVQLAPLLPLLGGVIG